MSNETQKPTLDAILVRTVSLPDTGYNLTYHMRFSSSWRGMRYGRTWDTPHELIFETWHLPDVGYLTIRLLDSPAPPIEKTIEAAERHLPAFVFTGMFHKELVCECTHAASLFGGTQDVEQRTYRIVRSYETNTGQAMRVHMAWLSHSCERFCLEIIMQCELNPEGRDVDELLMATLGPLTKTLGFSTRRIHSGGVALRVSS